jgi:hypothetical protein
MSTLSTFGDVRKQALLGQIAPPPIAPMGAPAMPALAPIVAPNVTVDHRMDSSAADPLTQRAGDITADLYKREHPVAPTSVLGKIGHTAANIGNVLGDIFAPATMSLIPGTQLHNEGIEQRDKADLEGISQLQSQADQRKQTEAATAYTQARPQIEQGKIQQKLLSTLGGKGLIAEKDEDGNLTGNVIDDPNNPASASRQIHDDTEKARQDYLTAQADVDRYKNDPNSPLYKLAITRAEIARQNANAAITRAQAYYGNYLEGAFNKDLHGNVLPGAPQIGDGNGELTTVGTKNAAQAVKAQANSAQFGDVFGALGSLESAAHHLVQSGGKLNSPGVAAALSQPRGTLTQWLQGEGAKANLTPAERDYVTANAAAHENIQAMRKAAGGTATDSSVAKLDALIPNASTPDLDYFLRQTGQIRSTASRLGKGVTTVSGGLKLPAENAPAGAPKAGDVEGGYRFKGGNPADKNNWEAVKK